MPHELSNDIRLKKLGIIRKISKPPRIVAKCLVPPPKWKLILLASAKVPWNQKVNFPLSFLFHMKTSVFGTFFTWNLATVAIATKSLMNSLSKSLDLEIFTWTDIAYKDYLELLVNNVFYFFHSFKKFMGNNKQDQRQRWITRSKAGCKSYGVQIISYHMECKSYHIIWSEALFFFSKTNKSFCIMMSLRHLK